MKLLIVEDEARMADLLHKGLTEEGHMATCASDGVEGLALAKSYEFDVIILDIMMPKLSGYELAKRLRAEKIRTPILMLTARDAVDDRVAGLDAGADDYLSKPFDFKELLARLRALARRPNGLLPPVLRVGDLMLNTASHGAMRAGRPVSLTAKEYALLEFLVMNEGRVVGREQIAQHVWDESFDPFSNVIDVYIKRLRGKLESGGRKRMIETRRGEGYILTADAEEPGA